MKKNKLEEIVKKILIVTFAFQLWLLLSAGLYCMTGDLMVLLLSSLMVIGIFNITQLDETKN